MYKIYDPKTQMYSSGGSGFVFKKKGKVWNSIGDINKHLHMVITSGRWGYVCRNIEKYVGCEVHHYTETGVEKFPINDLIVASIERQIGQHHPTGVLAQYNDLLEKFKEV